MTTRIRFLGEVPATTVAGTFNTADVSLSIASASGQPSTFPFEAVISRTVPAKRERIRVGGLAGTTYNTITRAIDGTTAKLHDVGETIELCISATYLDELGQFLGGTTGDLYYYGGASLSRLGIGAANTIAKSTGAAPAWATQSAMLDTLGSPVNQQALVRQGGVWVPSFLTLPQYATTAAATAAGANTDGAVIYVNTGDTAEGLYSFNGTSWRPISWNAPWGVVGVATANTAQTGITTVVDLTSLSITFTAVSGRRYRYSGQVSVKQQTSAGIVDLVLTTTAPLTIIQTTAQMAAANQNTMTFTGWELPGPGSTTRKLRMQTSAGTVDAQTGSITSYFIVEDVGPSAGPT